MIDYSMTSQAKSIHHDWIVEGIQNVLEFLAELSARCHVLLDDLPVKAVLQLLYDDVS